VALNIARAIARDDGYIPGLTDFLNSISPLLIEHDRWGFGVLHDAFDIGADAAIYLRARRPHWRRAPIRQRWLAKFGQVDTWNFCLRAAMMPRIRREDDEASAPNPRSGFQGKGGIGRGEGGEDAGRAGEAI